MLFTLWLLARQRLRAAEERVQQLRLGPGRGRAPRLPQRHFPAVNVYRQYANQGDRAFLATTRFTQAQFDELVEELRPLIEANRNVRPNVPDPGGEPRAAKLDTRNRLLLLLDFIVNGGSTAALGARYGVAPSVVSEEIRHVTLAIVVGLSYEVSWPTAAQQQALQGVLGPRFARAIGTIDGTYTQSFRRAGDFSGHRWLTIRHHQVAADALGYFIHVVAGGVGSRHDAYHFGRSGVGELLTRDNVDLLADSGYVGVHPHLITPATATSIPDDAAREAYNEAHTSRRSRIESFIGRLKILFRLAGRKWERADRKQLSLCFLVACILYNRRKRLNA